MKKKRKPTVTKLKRILWQLCREIIIKQYGTDCYTCPARALTGSNLHLSHFIPSIVCSAELRYSLDNLRPACYRCNIHCSGNWPAFEAHLIRDGVDVIALKAQHFATKGQQANRQWYEDKIVEYTHLTTPTQKTEAQIRRLGLVIWFARINFKYRFFPILFRGGF